MKAITIKKGPFAFGGLKIATLSLGMIFEGKQAEELIGCEWAKEYTEDQEATDADKLIAEKKAADLKAKEDAEKKEQDDLKAKEAKEAEEEALKEKDDADIKAMEDAIKLSEKEGKAKVNSQSKRKGK